MLHKLKFEIVDASIINGKLHNYHMADMSDVDNSGKWVIGTASETNNRIWKAGIEPSDNDTTPGIQPVKWLLSGVTFNEARQYLRTMHQTGQNYNSFILN